MNGENEEEEKKEKKKWTRTEKLMLASIIVELLEFIVQQIRSLA